MARVIMVNTVPRIRSELSIQGVNSIARTARQAGVMAFRGSVQLERGPVPEDAYPEPEVINLADTPDGVAQEKESDHELEPVEVAALGSLGLEEVTLVDA